RAGAALDLVEQAWTTAVGVVAVGAVADQERLLQRSDRPVDRAGGGEGAEIAALAPAGAAMLDEGRGLVVSGDENVGERLVVAQQHIEAGPQALDQVGLEQQRLGFRAR